MSHADDICAAFPGDDEPIAEAEPDPDPTRRWRAGLHAETLVGRSHALAAVLQDVAVVARTRVPVLLLGPTGAGKSTVARVLHDSSTRRRRPFVTVDCARLRPDRAEAELFGAVRGAYTGLDRPREGLLAAAAGGTVFLDEVGELPLEVQAQLLVFLQTRRFRAMGADVEREADVRVVAATSRPVSSLLEPLYWRLAGMEIEIPGLERRREDVPELARALLGRAAVADDLPCLPLGAAALSELSRRSWPGNVRQLERAVVRGLLRAAHAGAREIGVVHLDLPRAAHDPEEPEGLEEAERRFRLRHCEAVLGRCGGNKKLAAERLRISRSTLYDIFASASLGSEPVSGPADGSVRAFGHTPWAAAG